ncbi:APC family permease [Kutzneria buriramensis]|uniref:Amino acid transporter n=1 Tax=Kutzneria buriramensis TaxID=1045776 RepID=A0A3E0IAN4_9PSEU|nr:APC family permease [Kutzneria buriramensis]REH55661.1 amino acid transporter [Kutzneria buriramensis]
MFDVVKRLLVGRPLRSERLGDTLLPKWLALPVFCSDPISSVAYATEQILLTLAVGGAGALSLSTPVAAAVAIVLIVVVASYRQTCYAYPSGGGAFVVSKENLGETAALTAAAALLVDYVMTVAVSVVSGVVAIISAFPELAPDAVPISVGCVVVIALVNLRGVKESGKSFAIPTYAFIVLTFLMFAVAAVRGIAGDLPPASTANLPFHQTESTAGFGAIFLSLRAFASGCTALTGVEAISNGVPAFRKPKSHNAALTLVMMGVIAVAMFGGITALAVHLNAHALPDGNPSVISQVATSVFGGGSVLFYLFQAATAGILVLAANTAFNGFPGLASILARERYLPRQLHNRGDRLVFSNGILLLAAAAIVLIIGFDANIDALIQLYIIGVFTSFTLSQAGMVVHWKRALATETDAGKRARMRGSQAINAFGAGLTMVVLIVVFATKVVHGAWLAVLAMVVLFVVMRSISRYYRRFEQEVANVKPTTTLPPKVHALVLISRLHQPALQALAFAKATRPDRLEAVTVATDDEETRRLQQEWDRRGIKVPLVVLSSPYRDVSKPIVDHVSRIHARDKRGVVSVFIPEYVVRRWWQHLLHNQSALRLKARLLFTPGVVVVNVPYHIGLADQGWMTQQVLPEAATK